MEVFFYGFLFIFLVFVFFMIFCFVVIELDVDFDFNMFRKIKAKKIIKSYRKCDIYPILKYAKKNSYFDDCDISNITLEEGFDITLLINIYKANIPIEYKTIIQKKAYLIASNYNNLSYKHEYYKRFMPSPYYATVSDDVLKEILNNNDLLEIFAANYYDDAIKENGRGVNNCIHHFAKDENVIAKQIIEKAKELWPDQPVSTQ